MQLLVAIVPFPLDQLVVIPCIFTNYKDEIKRAQGIVWDMICFGCVVYPLMEKSFGAFTFPMLSVSIATAPATASLISHHLQSACNHKFTLVSVVWWWKLKKVGYTYNGYHWVCIHGSHHVYCFCHDPTTKFLLIASLGGSALK